MKRSKVMRVIVMLVVLVPVATMLSGCPAGTYGSVVEPEQVAAIVRGKTTKAQLLEALGDPDETTDLGNGKEELLYIQQTVAHHSNWLHSTKSGFWVILSKGVVEAFGERATVPDESHRWWSF